MWNSLQDLRFATRTLLKRPGFTAVALLPLALGIGATTAIFTVVETVLLRPLAYDRPETIVRVSETWPQLRGGPSVSAFSLDHFREWRDSNRVFEHMAAYSDRTFNLTGVDEPRRISGAQVSPSLFPLLRVQPLLGRGLQPEEEQPGRGRVIVLSHNAWQSTFGSLPDVLGQTVRLDNEAYTVVGVMPGGFEFPDKETQFWTPLTLEPPKSREPGEHAVKLVPVVARLKDDVTLEQAQGEADALARRLLQEEADPMAEGMRFHLTSLHEEMVGPVRPALLALFAAVGFVLLIACANVANLLLARATGRQKDIAVRAAFGAGRSRLIREMLTESFALAFLAGALGCVFAYWAVRLLVASSPGGIPRLERATIDLTVLGFALGAVLATTLLSGLAPALKISSVDLVQSLKEGTASSAASGFRLFHQRGRSLFTILEVALALVLLVGAGLMARSFTLLTRVDPGYDPRHVLTAELNLPSSSYPPGSEQLDLYDRLRQGVRDLPDVEAVGLVNQLPLSRGRIMISLGIEDRPAEAPGEQDPHADLRFASPGYFRAMGIQLLRGRTFDERDGPDTPPVLVINQSLAGRYFLDEDPVGKRMELGEIVGIVADAKQDGLDTEARPEFYISYRQTRDRMGFFLSKMNLVVRSRTAPLTLVPAIRTRLAALDPELPFDEVMTMEERVSRSVARPRFYAVLFGLFGFVALLLAASGVYGVVSYSVSQRTRETGIRVACGARPADISRMILREGLTVVLAGVAIGLGAALGLTRILSTLLFGVSTTDPMTYAGIVVLLATVALVACYVPARRATLVDPTVALRYE